MQTRNGFMTALVLIFLVVASIMLLTLYQLVGNYRTNAIRMQVSSQLGIDVLNLLNIGAGFMRSRSTGVLGFNIPYQTGLPSWYTDFKSKLSEEWKDFFEVYADNKSFLIAEITPGGSSATESQIHDELVEYLSNRKLSNVSIYAIKSKNPFSALVIAKAEREGKGVYAYAIVTSKLLNQYVYFTNSEKRSDGTTIYFHANDLIDGPIRSHDYININNAGGKPTFTSPIEILGIKDMNGNIVNPADYSNFANLLGNPTYRLLTEADVAALDFNAIKNEYKNSIASLVRSYDEIRSQPLVLSGIKFNSDITISFAHGQSVSNYDIKISQGNTDYIISWNPSSPDARIRKQGGGPAEEFNIKFNGVVYATGDITIDGPTELSTYKGNYTLFSENDIIIKDRLIPYDTFASQFTNNERGNNGDSVSKTKLPSIKDFVNTQETSSLNLVAINNVRVGKKLTNMKIFASLFAFDGSFTVDGYNTGRSSKQLFVFGSIMQNYRGPVGTFDPRTGRTITGYYKIYAYDPRIMTGAYQPYGTPARSQTVSVKVVGIVK
ncbi:hypothetical protein [Fervidobacterium pennivorans]|uniref:hypothetical protein n=1 Tax=Fervidobacterium pennivorans TaxID=93466 RepID=UPI001436A2D7|nr:hypothetical protein [Fervidobacterium pennivorans]QIV78929.1 hypothetical protein HER11_08360 [Fervidobacterium pennivorans subsp. keratinolyticus]